MANQTVSYSNGVITITKRDGSQVQMNFSGASVASGAKVTAQSNISLDQLSPTVNVLSFNNVEFDNGGYYNAANPTRLTAPAAGRYQIGFNSLIQANATGNRLIAFRKNGSGNFGFDRVVNAGASDTSSLMAFMELDLNAGDYIECTVTHNAGGTITTIGAPTFPAFWMQRVG